MLTVAGGVLLAIVLAFVLPWLALFAITATGLYALRFVPENTLAIVVVGGIGVAIAWTAWRDKVNHAEVMKHPIGAQRRTEFDE